MQPTFLAGTSLNIRSGSRISTAGNFSRGLKVGASPYFFGSPGSVVDPTPIHPVRNELKTFLKIDRHKIFCKDDLTFVGFGGFSGQVTFGKLSCWIMD